MRSGISRVPRSVSPPVINAGIKAGRRLVPPHSEWTVPSQTSWTILRWDSETFRFVAAQPGEHSIRPKKKLGRRIPRVDTLLSQNRNDDPLPREYMEKLATNPSAANRMLQDIKADPNTLEEYAMAYAAKIGRMPLLPDSISERADRIRRAIPSASNEVALHGRTPLEILSARMDDEDNYSDSYARLSTTAKRDFEQKYTAFNQVKQRQLDQGPSPSPLLRVLQKQWSKESLAYIPSGYPVLREVRHIVPEAVASIMAQIATEMSTVTFPHSVTSTCTRIGSAIEDVLLKAVANRLGLPYWYRGSPFLWSLVGGQRWSAKDRVKVGSVYLEQAIKKCKFMQPHPETGEPTLRPALWRTFYHDGASRRGVLMINPALVKQICTEPIVSSEQMPMVVKPRPWIWSHPADGGYECTSRRRLTLMPPGTSSSEQQSTVAAAIESGVMIPALRGLDRISECAWRVNPIILKTLDALVNAGRTVSDMPSLRNAMAEERRKQRKGYETTAKQYHQALDIARSLADCGHRFYSPAYMDFRGRCYPASASKLSYMGSDSLRALHQFWEGRCLGSRGLRSLEIHLANVYGAVSGSSEEEKVSWARRCRAAIVNTAADPLRSVWWLEGAKPFQVLAACAEIAAAIASGDPASYISHLPVAIDGTCNGLQHLTALARDSPTAGHVNLVESEIPGDVYREVAKAASDICEITLSRSDAKLPVMMTFYGATRHTRLGSLTEKFGDKANKVLDAIDHVVEQKYSTQIGIQRWLTDNAARIVDSCAGDDPARIGRTVAWTQPVVGTPIVQPYTIAKPMVVRTSLQTFYLDSPFHFPEVDGYKQRVSVAPNYVHSLDAAHMLMTAAAFQGVFAAVHDSFWTHAADVESLAAVTRSQFALLHARSLLQDLKDEWTARYHGQYQLCVVARETPLYEQIKWLRSGRSASACLPGELEVENKLASAAGDGNAMGMKTPWSLIKASGVAIDYNNGKPRIGEGSGTKVWVPLIISDPPASGSLDITQVLHAKYLFS